MSGRGRLREDKTMGGSVDTRLEGFARRAARIGALPLVALTLIGCIASASASAAEEPVYTIKAVWGDTYLPPGGEAQFTLKPQNVGTVDGSGPLTITDQLPTGVTVKSIETDENGDIATNCTGVGTETVTCELLAEEDNARKPGPGAGNPFALFPTGYLRPIFINVDVSPSANGTSTNLATISGGGYAGTATDTDPVTFSATPANFGLVPGGFLSDVFDGEAPTGQPLRQAGAHPYELRVDFDLNQETGVYSNIRYTGPHGHIRDAIVTSPRGLIGNPEAMPKCDPDDFASFGRVLNSTQCPPDTQVGYINVFFSDGLDLFGYGVFNSGFLNHVPIYNLVPPHGQVADFAFNAGGFVQAHIYPTLDPAQNYAVKSVAPDISNLLIVRGAETRFWGVPADPAHDRFRYFNGPLATPPATSAPWGSAPIRPFLTNPMDCGFDNGGTRIRVDSWTDPGNFTPAEEYKDPLNVTGCDDLRFRFDPKVDVQPTSKDAGAPSGLNVKVVVPQRSDEVQDPTDLYAENGDVQAIPTPPLKKAVVTFPEGMTVSPSAAQGLSSCSPSQIGLGTDSPVTCPAQSQLGKLTVHTPLLPHDEPAEGFIYVAKSFDNPFHNFLTLYLVIQEPARGILAKIPGKVDLDPNTGRITSTFDDLPQFPLEDTTIAIKGGLRAGLVNPQTCGTKTIDATLFTWQDPSTPHHATSRYEVTQNPDGSPCHKNLSDRPFNPTLLGGTVNNAAGSFSPLDIQMVRGDEDQELRAVDATAPPGLLGSLRGVGRCSEAAIARAANPERTGEQEITGSSCPADSLVGTVDAGSGVGQILTYVHGKIYLAGPYKGAPLSGVAIVPAVAGPFDLGTVVTRAPAYVDPQKGQLRIKTDDLPQIFKGVPVRIRDVRIHLDRQKFTLNPTNCERFALGGTLFSTEGKSKESGSPFQAADCATLGFKPRLSANLFGGTIRGSHPKFKASYKPRSGDANLDSAVVTLPRSAFLDQSHIRTVCTRVQFAAGGGGGAGCPAASIYGHAEARTPLLEETLQGPVYLRSSDHKLPDLVVALRGIVDVEVSARIDSIKGGIRATFEDIPDVPVESFAIAMQGGRKGLLTNSRNVCERTYKMKAELGAQNKKQITLRPPLGANCKVRKAKKRGR